jgi:hypothetical protein
MLDDCRSDNRSGDGSASFFAGAVGDLFVSAFAKVTEREPAIRHNQCGAINAAK